MVVLPPELVEEIVARTPYDCLHLLQNFDNDVWNATVVEHLEKRRTVRFFVCHYPMTKHPRKISYVEKRLRNPIATFPFDRTSLFHSSMKRFTSLETVTFCSNVPSSRIHYHRSEATECDLMLAFKIFPVSSQRVHAPVPQRFSALQLIHDCPMFSYEFWENIPTTFQLIHLDLGVDMLYLNFPATYVDDFVERIRQSRRNVAMFIDLFSERTNPLSPRRRHSLVDLFLQPQSEYLAVSATNKNHFFELEDFQRISEFWNKNDGYAYKVLMVPVRPEHVAAIVLLFARCAIANMKCKVSKEKKCAKCKRRSLLHLEFFREGYEPTAEQCFDEHFSTMLESRVFNVIS